MALKQVLLLTAIMGFVAPKAFALPPEALYEEYTEPTNRAVSTEYEDLINKQTNIYVEDLLLEAWNMVSEKISYRMALGPNDEYMSCSHFVWRLFQRSGLDFPYTPTASFDKNNRALMEHFVSMPAEPGGGFKPKTGDILSYNHGGNGHMVVVIDPQKCIAVNSAAWVWDAQRNRSIPAEKGVRFHQIYRESRCKDGIWHAWDKASNKFETMFRHNVFVE